MTSERKQKCSYCNKFINKSDFDAKQYFETQCDLCNKSKLVHTHCATSIYIKSTGCEPGTLFGKNVDLNTFKNTNTTLWCIDCRADKCFFCGKEHKSNETKVLCNVCKKTWCRILKPLEEAKKDEAKKDEAKKDQSKKKKKKESTQACRQSVLTELRKLATCKQCKSNPPIVGDESSKNSKNSSSMTTDDCKTASNEEETSKSSNRPLKRFYNSENNSYLMTMPTEDFKEKFQDLVTGNLKVYTSNDDSNTSIHHIPSMDVAKQFFDSRVVFFGDTNCSIFDAVKLNECYEEQIIPNRLDGPVKLFKVSYKNVKSMYDNNWLSMDCISFILRALNEVHSGSGIPQVIFGDYSVNNFLDLKGYPVIWNYLTESVESKKEVTKERQDVFMNAMKKWYTGVPQGLLGRILDHFQKKGQRITTFNNVIHINEDHWVYINVVLEAPPTLSSTPDEKESPYVYTIDNKHIEDKIVETKMWRMFYAKFFGLYYKENFLNEPLVDEDFNGSDLINNMMNSNIESNHEHYGSLLNHFARNPKFQQTDNNNCGVIALYHCISKMRMDNAYEEEMKKLCDDDDKDVIQNEFKKKRTELLSLIANVWGELHGERYRKYDEQLILNLDHRRSKVVTSSDIMRWKECHKIFEKGIIQYIYNSNGTTANTIFQSVTKTSDLINKKFSSLLSSTETEQSSDDDDEEFKEEDKPKTKASKKRTRLSLGGQAKKPKKNEKNSKDMKGKYESKKSDKSPEEDTASLQVCNLCEMDRCREPGRRSSNRSDLSNKVIDLSEVIVYTGSQIINDPIEARNHSMKPYETVNVLSTLFKNSYYKQKSPEKDTKAFTEHVRDVMSKFTTLFLMDVVTNESDDMTPKYEVVAAAVVEPSVELNLECIDHAIIHLFAIRMGYERKEHPKVLLLRIAQFLGRSKHVAFISKWKGVNHVVRKTAITNEDTTPVTPESIFKDVSFVLQKNKFLNELIEPENIRDVTSEYMFGHTDNIKQIFGVHSKTDASYKLCKIVLPEYHYCKRKTNGRYMLYSHPFQWSDCTTTELGYMKEEAKIWCSDNRNKPLKLVGGGYRPRNDTDRLSDDDKIEKLRDEFQVLTDGRWSNCCAWLSAMLLINVDNENLATHMLEVMDEEPLSDFEWMCFTRDPTGKGKTLIKRLQKNDIQYNLKTVAYYGKDKTYIDIMLDEDTKGQYLCQLKALKGESTHVVGVDCNKKCIYDCCEQYALKLTKENLDYCCGEGAELDKIILCYQLEPAKNK